MTNMFSYLIEKSDLAKLVFSYTYKNKKTGESYIIYRDGENYNATEENKYDNKENFVGVIDNGIFLPNNII